jgi:SAM-dependent methyltransferase
MVGVRRLPMGSELRVRRIVALRLFQGLLGVLLDPLALLWRIVEAPAFVRNAVGYRGRAPEDAFKLRLRYLYPVLGERHAAAGQAKGHYFHQDIWAARHIRQDAPARHVDVGSRVDGFIAHLLIFREVDYVDLRPLDTDVHGLHSRQGSILNLPYADASLQSLSSLHVVEHIGLGRYGDPVDPDAWKDAVAELKRVLAPGGILYVSVPVGRERVEFDAHRVFAPETILHAFQPLELLEFCSVDDDGDFHGSSDPARFNGWYCCGMFRLRNPI